MTPKKKIYIACCQDRHTDADIQVFWSEENAVQYAKDFVKDDARFPDAIKEIETEGWLYHAQYSEEGDYVYVFESEMNP